MDIRENTAPIGDEPRDKKTYQMATCDECGGRGGTYDSEGNWLKCYRCSGSGQI